MMQRDSNIQLRRPGHGGIHPETDIAAASTSCTPAHTGAAAHRALLRCRLTDVSPD